MKCSMGYGCNQDDSADGPTPGRDDADRVYSSEEKCRKNENPPIIVSSTDDDNGGNGNRGNGSGSSGGSRRCRYS
jgi:hypothetical protein